jgi:large subunit ribosomal protein L30
MSNTRLRITWVKSGIGYSQRQKETIRALGLKHLGTTVEQADTPVIRGMISKISHLVQVEVTGQNESRSPGGVGEGQPLPLQGGDLRKGK